MILFATLSETGDNATLIDALQIFQDFIKRLNRQSHASYHFVGQADRMENASWNYPKSGNDLYIQMDLSNLTPCRSYPLFQY